MKFVLLFGIYLLFSRNTAKGQQNLGKYFDFLEFYLCCAIGIRYSKKVCEGLKDIEINSY